jgi:DNA-nicking Smr family endonuclease
MTLKVRDLIATYAPAHKKHGGTGAWYVFLKD